MMEASTTQYAALQKIPGVAIHKVTTGQTAVARMQEDKEVFKDPKVRKAMRLAINTPKVLQIAHLGLGAPAEHHHVAPVHPEYYKLPFMKQNIAEAKKLLAEAGIPMASKSRSSARRTRIGRRSPSRPWSICGRRSASM